MPRRQFRESLIKRSEPLEAPFVTLLIILDTLGGAILVCDVSVLPVGVCVFDKGLSF